jgi:hypothetical protein
MQERGFFVIEDAAHAPGAELNGKRAGSFGDAGCFSFYPTKIMTTGEGGMVVTGRKEVADTARSLQHRGRDMENPNERYITPGRNNRFTEIAAAMGLSQLRCLPDFLARRRQVAATYDELLLKSELFVPLLSDNGSVPSYWRYVVLPTVKIDREQLRAKLAKDRITVDWAYDPPLHLQPVFQRIIGTKAECCRTPKASVATYLSTDSCANARGRRPICSGSAAPTHPDIDRGRSANVVKIAIHQPQYFPWPPYVHKVVSADIFVYLDTVQFTKNGVQNRNRIKTPTGAQWLTLPVRHQFGASIRETSIADPGATGKHWKTVVNNYSRTRDLSVGVTSSRTCS